MSIFNPLILFVLFALSAPAALAADASVKISSPEDGAVVDPMEQTKVSYEVQPGPRGDHTHLYVNGKEKAILRQLRGAYSLDSLSPGKHEICIKVVNKSHTPIGVDNCVTVAVR